MPTNPPKPTPPPQPAPKPVVPPPAPVAAKPTPGIDAGETASPTKPFATPPTAPKPDAPAKQPVNEATLKACGLDLEDCNARLVKLKSAFKGDMIPANEMMTWAGDSIPGGVSNFLVNLLNSQYPSG